MRVSIWMKALSATMVAQLASSFAAATIPLLGTVLTLRWGVSPHAIGYASAATSAGICWCLACGTPMLNHYGPVRTLQIALGVVMLAVVCIAQSSFVIGLAGAFILGLGLAPNNPAGSSLLIRTAPAHRRNLIFSIRQAGVPVAGALAGAVMAPALATVGLGWGVVTILIILAMSIFAMQPARQQLDSERLTRRDWPRAFLSLKTVFNSLPALRSHRELPLLTLIGASFSIAQSCVLAFLAAYLIAEADMDLLQAGQSMAVLLVASAAARVGFGWLADRQHFASPMLYVLLILAAVSMGGLFVSTHHTHWPIYVAVALVGATSLGWTGIYMAELARLAPPSLVGEVTSVANLFGFAGSIAGPLMFSIIAKLTHSFATGFLLVAAQLFAIGIFALARHLILQTRRRPEPAAPISR